MIPKTIITGICIVFLIAIVVFAVELFVPLSAKAELDLIGRKALLNMENNNGLSQADIQRYKDELRNIGFENITIATTADAKKGDEISLFIEADYKYSKLLNLFARTDIIQAMRYSKTTIARQVVN